MPWYRRREWQIAAVLVAVAAGTWIETGDPWAALPPAMVALAVGLLAARDRLAAKFLAPNRRRDVRAALAFAIFFALLLAVALVVAAVRAV
jgi:hypothetical protein